MFKPQPVLKKYYDGLEEGKIYATKCNECGRVNWPPYPICQNHECTSNDLEWTEICGDAEVTDILDMKPMLQGAHNKPLMPYMPITGNLAEGTEFVAALQGVTPDQYEDLHSKMPFKVESQIVRTGNNIPTVTFKIVDES